MRCGGGALRSDASDAAWWGSDASDGVAPDALTRNYSVSRVRRLRRLRPWPAPSGQSAPEPPELPRPPGRFRVWTSRIYIRGVGAAARASPGPARPRAGTTTQNAVKRGKTPPYERGKFVSQICWGSQMRPSDAPAEPWILMHFQTFKSTFKPDPDFWSIWRSI